MKINYPYLKDKNFLKELTQLHIKDYYVKITILNWLEQPIQDIQGRVISANITVDGNSSLRRTANLSMIADQMINNLTNVENLVSINKKVNMQIGYINTTSYYTDYPIIWFPLGIYVIISSSIANSNSGLTISLQLKDKMCLLNGQCGGTFDASCTFDSYDTINQDGVWQLRRPPIYQIIRELVNHFGGQQLGKIIISDLDTRVKQVMKWTGNTPLYVTHSSDDDNYYITTNPNEIPQNYQNIQNSPFEYGSDVGYIYTDFVYIGDLIGDAGQSVVDILQKIKNYLGNYEYFYDVNGNFIFQQIKNYLNNAESKYILDSLNNRQLVPDYIADIENTSDAAYLLDISNGKSVFSFENNELISSYNNTPQFGMIKNNYIVWGIRKSADGYEMPIRYHLAIDSKPQVGNTYQAFEYQDEEEGLTKWHSPIVFDSFSDFPQTGAAGVFYLDSSQNPGKIYKWGLQTQEDGSVIAKYIELDTQLQSITTTDWRTELYFQGVMAQPYGTDSNYYYTELLNEWPKIYDIRNGKLKEQSYKNPSSINYYLDFIDYPSIMSEFSVSNIGRRTQVLNEGSNVNCIFESWIPDLVLIPIQGGRNDSQEVQQLRQECIERGQNYYQVSDAIYDALEMGGVMNSGYQFIRQLLHQYTSYNNTISIQTLPIYFLQPNTRITVKDNDSNIYGDFMINSLSFALDNTSTLTINATKALQKI